MLELMYLTCGNGESRKTYEWFLLLELYISLQVLQFVYIPKPNLKFDKI